MTVQDIGIPGDIGLKDGTRISIEHRAYGESPKQVMLLQLLIKNHYALVDASRPENITKYGSKICLVIQTDIRDREYLEFLRRHHLAPLSDGATVVKYYFDLTKNNHIAQMSEVLPIIRNVAGLFVDELRRHKVNLDYSIDSLELVDKWILAQRASGSMNKDIVVLAGCYLGEVIVRNLNGKWEFGFAGEYGLQVDIKGAKGNIMGKVAKLIKNGQEDSLYFFVKVISKNIKDGTI
ncbi:MAG: hypothetical protein IPJ89_05175 [Candidatus Iainarchaeum archaeon]|uniref:Uncharacterized protein n=1 Tax=Candidatus Iainarchaeum sp. TaxID=3101447 RepID=A0A7T9I114_9ARCH|nr:MAG: hypothetical protein IPJ89_05175 [Candidatus Diapherotrites archaeon]